MSSRSSPARRSQPPPVSSPERLRRSFLFDAPRNDELSHLDALAAAQAEHERVRQAAMRVYEMHELKEESERIRKQQEREQARLKAEAELAAKESKLQELRAKSIPKPTPPPPTPEPKPEPARAPEPPKQLAKAPEIQPQQRKVEAQPVVKQEAPPTAKPQTNGFGFGATKPAQPAAPSAQQPSKPPATNLAFPAPAAQQKPQPAPVQAPPKAPEPPKPAASTERYVQIHQELKKLRQSLQTEASVKTSPLKGPLGTYRREIRVSIGQLTSGRGANAQPVCPIPAPSFLTSR